MVATILPLSQDVDVGLVEKVTQSVKQRIQTDRLRIGDPLPAEASFATDLGVSRTVVREAFRALAALGIIQLVNGRRARVGAIEADVLELRSRPRCAY